MSILHTMGPFALEEQRKAEELHKLLKANRAQGFSPQTLAKIKASTERASIFDIETGGLDAKTPIYEMGAQHGLDDPRFFHRFVSPTNIHNDQPGTITPWSQSYIDKRGTGFQAALTAEGIPQAGSANTALDALAGRDIWMQNGRFENSFIMERLGKAPFDAKANSKSFWLESSTAGGGLYPTNDLVREQLGHAKNASFRGTQQQYLDAWEGVFTKGFAPALKDYKGGQTRVFELMDLTKSIYAMAQNRDLMPKTGELFTGTSVNTFSKAMYYGMEEFHTALADSSVSGEMIHHFLGAGYAMQAGEALPDVMKQYFKYVGDMQPQDKFNNRVNNITKTFQKQQRFLAAELSGESAESIRARLGERDDFVTSFKPVAKKKTLFSRAADGTTSESEFEVTHRHNKKTTLNIEELVQSWDVRDKNFHGIRVDNQAALKEAQKAFIAPYNAYVELRMDQGIPRHQAMVAALESPSMVTMAEAVDAKARKFIPSAAAAEEVSKTIVERGRGFLRENWKVGLGALGAIWAANKIAGDDDAYNYIEGMGHSGFGGATRKQNTDFGSGWNPLRALQHAGETFAKMTAHADFAEAIAKSSHISELSKGMFGQTTIRRASFRGQDFDFVRKTTLPGRESKVDLLREAAYSHAVSDSVSPNVYSASPTHIDFELFQGKTLRELNSHHLGSVPESLVDDAIAKVHEQNIFHNDLNPGNIMYIPEEGGPGKIGIIDFGHFGTKTNSGPGQTFKRWETKIIPDKGQQVTELKTDWEGAKLEDLKRGRQSFRSAKRRKTVEEKLHDVKALQAEMDPSIGMKDTIDPMGIFDTIHFGQSARGASADKTLVGPPAILGMDPADNIWGKFDRNLKHKAFRRTSLNPPGRIQANVETHSIAGQQEGGLNEKLRHKVTDMGSPWQGLKNLISRIPSSLADAISPAARSANLGTSTALTRRATESFRQVGRKSYPIGRADKLRLQIDVYKKAVEVNKRIAPWLEPFRAIQSKLKKTMNPSNALSGGFLHATDEKGFQGISATNRLMPGSRNARHSNGDVGTYFFRGSKDRGLTNAAGGAGAAGAERFIYIPENEPLGSGLLKKQEEIFATTNQSVGFNSLRISSEKILDPAHVSEGTRLLGAMRGLEAPNSSYNRMRSILKTPITPNRSWTDIGVDQNIIIDADYSISTTNLAVNNIERLLEKKAHNVYIAEGVSFHDYDPSHIGRPTKTVTEEHGYSLAFGEAEKRGLSDPSKLSAHRNVRKIAQDVEAAGGTLYIKGGVAREKLVGGLRPEAKRVSKDIDLLVTGDMKSSQMYDIMDKHKAYFDVQMQPNLDTFFRGTDLSANQAVLQVPTKGGQRHRLLHTQGAADDIQSGTLHYLDNSDPGRAAQRIEKFKGYYPSMDVVKGQVPGGDEAYRVVEGRPRLKRIQANISGKSIDGFPKGGPAGQRRKDGTDFGSPWMGLKLAVENVFEEGSAIVARQRIAEENKRRREEERERASPNGINKFFGGGELEEQGISGFEVEDADTVKLFMSGGNAFNLRLAGIDAPEIEHDDGKFRVWGDQPYGHEAKNKLQELLEAQSNLRVITDPNSSGSYGRKVGMLVGDNNSNLNLELVRQGAAAALPYGKRSEQIASSTEFRRAEQDALAAQKGMWGTEEWQIAHQAQLNSKRRTTNVSYTDLGRLYNNFKTSSILLRMRNPDSDLADMTSSGNRSDHNIIEGLDHGWAQASRADNTDFGSGWTGLKQTARKVTGSSKALLQDAHFVANTNMRQLMKHNTQIGHHRG